MRLINNHYKTYALGLLLVINLLNYVDRQVLYAVFPLIKKNLNLSDTALGLLGSAFMLCYMVSAPILAWLADRFSRTKFAALGLSFWSLSTILTGCAPGYQTLLLARTGVGMGEASFGTVSPGLVADFFDDKRRGRVLSYFFLAIPVGSALGYLLGGLLGHHFGWQAAFMIVGLPGLLLAFPLWFLREPDLNAGKHNLQKQAVRIKDYLTLFQNRSFVVNTLSMAAMTFALGGLAQWMPTFICRIHGLDLPAANMIFGAITVLSGLTGTLAGGWLGDRLGTTGGKGYLMVSGWGFLFGVPVAVYTILAQSAVNSLSAMFVAEFLLFLSTSPLNTVIINVTPRPMRAMAFAVNIFFIHALGDAVSPVVLGYLSDLWGLRTALLITPGTILLAGILSLFCLRYVKEDAEKARNI